MTCQAYPGDVTDEEWVLVALALMLMTEAVPQRMHALREVFDGLGWIVRAGYDGAERKRGSKLPLRQNNGKASRLVRDYERLPEILVGLHCSACAIRLLKRFIDFVAKFTTDSWSIARRGR